MNIFIKAHKMGCLPFYEFHDTIYYLITFFPLSRPFRTFFARVIFWLSVSSNRLQLLMKYEF